MNEKICRTCGELKSLEDYQNCSRNKDGKKSACRECRNASGRRYRKENAEEIKERSRARGPKTEYHREYRKKNKDRLSERKREYYIENNEKIKKYGKEYRQKNKDSLRKKKREWYKERGAEARKNRRRFDPVYRARLSIWEENAREGRNKRRRERAKTDENYRLSCALRSRVKDSLKRQSAKKRNSSIEYLGCTIDFYKKYIEEKFEVGMSWDNYGEWHIDHIIPIASFDLTKEENINRCFNYANTQPMWATENRSKGAGFSVNSIREQTNERN